MKTMSLVWLSFALSLAGCATRPTASGPVTDTDGKACKSITDGEVAALFERWNDALKSGVARNVLARYAEPSILLPTRYHAVRLTPGQKLEYFTDFLKNEPSAVIDMRFIDRSCNIAVDAGLYTFTFAATRDKVAARYIFTYHWNGTDWLIKSHHSSVIPPPRPTP
jgi:hypothetical protein